MISRKGWFIIFVALTSLSLAGCGGDETTNPNYGFSAIAGTVWKTKIPLLLYEVIGTPKGHLVIIVPTEKYVNEFRKGTADPFYGGQPGEKVIDLLPIGTTIRLDRLIARGGDVGGMYVEGRIMNGPQAGKSAELGSELFIPNEFMGHPRGNTKTWSIRPEMLEK